MSQVLTTRFSPSRRHMLARGVAGAVGVASTVLTGCGGRLRRLSSLVRAPRMHVAVIGVPGSVASSLSKSLGVAAQGYVAAGRGELDVTVTTGAAPPNTWFYCGPLRPACGPTSLPESGLELENGSTQITTPAGLPLAVAGRTALGVRFGSAALPIPQPGSTNTRLPDLVIAYDMWAYWLGVLAADPSAAWKLNDGDVQGLPTQVSERLAAPVPGQGLRPCVVPLLRNPMLIGVEPSALWHGANEEWTWSLVEQLMRESGSPVTVGFAPSKYYPDTTECALAMLVENGGILQASNSPLNSALVEAVVAWFRQTLALGASPATQAQGAVWPSYLWSPFWSEGYGWNSQSGVHEFPRGSDLQRTPCTYLCAFAAQSSPLLEQVMDFALYLVSPGGQEALMDGGAGLVLRPEQATVQIQRYYPFISSAKVVGDPATDLAPSAIYQGTIGGAGGLDAMYAAVDKFASALESATVD